MVIDGSFQYLDFYILKRLAYPNKNYFYTFNTVKANPIFVVFLWGFNY